MNSFVLMLYVFLVGIALLTIALTYNRLIKCRKPFYSPFFYYILFSFIYGFLNYFGRFYARLILAEHHLRNFTRNTIDLFLNGLALPFCLIGLYFYFIFIRELLEQKKSRRLRLWLLFIEIFMMVILTVDYIEYLNSSGGSVSRFMAISLAAVNFVFVLISYAAILQIVFYRNTIKEKARRKALVRFAVVVIALDSIYFLLLYKVLVGDLFYYFVPTAFSLSLFIQFVYVKHFIDRYYIVHSLGYESIKDLSDIYKKQNITEREKEIIELLRLGKSNREIHEKLCISLQTVKNNIYNIFQKLNVRNRVELTILVNRVADERAEPK
jgi:DNA-binding CsgD family transcriptional regulator